MLNFLAYLHSEDIERSVDFYSVLDFIVTSDDVDGSEVRRVRLGHANLAGLLIALENKPSLLRNSSTAFDMSLFPLSVAFTIVTDEYLKWVRRFKSIGITPTFYVNEPWGTWTYYLDPSGNLFCISDSTLW
jgi:hypothetical protein